jgi:hypothetical protein
MREVQNEKSILICVKGLRSDTGSSKVDSGGIGLGIVYTHNRGTSSSIIVGKRIDQRIASTDIFHKTVSRVQSLVLNQSHILTVTSTLHTALK